MKIKQEKKGIWQFADLLPDIPFKYRLTLGEGNTSLKKIEEVYFKCEFENPTGSIKDRSMAFQISKLRETGVKAAVISSSGNAAISAANYCSLAGIKLTVFVSPRINKNKLKQLKKQSCSVIASPKAVSEAFLYAKQNQVYNLRQSKDPNAVFGTMTVVFELTKQQSNTDAVFIPVSSGTNLIGIAQGYLRLDIKPPAIHAVQSEAVCPIASIFEKNYQKKNTSLADAIVAKFTPREDRILEVIKKSRGSAWVISDKDMLNARKWLVGHKIICSYEGAAVLAALWKARKVGFDYKHPVCILTGKYYEPK